MRLGIAHHLGWAVAVTADDRHRVVDRRRIELIEPGFPNAPIHHEGGPHELHRSGPPLDDDALAALVGEVRASVRRATSAALEALARDVGDASSTGADGGRTHGCDGGADGRSIDTICLREWPDDFPAEIAVLRRPPHESRADSVMYLRVLAEAADGRGWTVHRYDHRTVESEAAAVLGDRADEVLRDPRRQLGPPWSKDHRTALAATIVTPR